MVGKAYVNAYTHDSWLIAGNVSEGIVRLESVGLDISIDEVYRRITWV